MILSIFIFFLRKPFKTDFLPRPIPLKSNTTPIFSGGTLKFSAKFSARFCAAWGVERLAPLNPTQPQLFVIFFCIPWDEIIVLFVVAVTYIWTILIFLVF